MTKIKEQPVNARVNAPVNAVEFAKAIADETRQRIMKLCCCTRLTVGDITEQIGVSQPTVSHHLAILRDAGLVTIERQGRETYYSLDQERITFCCGQLMLQFAPNQNVAVSTVSVVNQAACR